MLNTNPSKSSFDITDAQLCNILSTASAPVLRLFLEHNVETEITAAYGSTPLLLRVAPDWKGFKDSTSTDGFIELRLLLEHGANIEATAPETLETPLLHAAKEKDPALPKFLLSHGADHSARDRDGNDALLQALMHGNLETAKALLIHGASATTLNAEGTSELGLACAEDGLFRGTSTYVRMADLLLHHGADIELSDS